MVAKIYKFPSSHIPRLQEVERDAPVNSAIAASEKRHEKFHIFLNLAILFTGLIIAFHYLVTKIPPHTLYTEIPQTIGPVYASKLETICGKVVSNFTSSGDLERCFADTESTDVSQASVYRPSLPEHEANKDSLSRLYLVEPFAGLTRRDRIAINFTVSHEHLRAGSDGRASWALVYYLDTPSRICIGARCGGILESGLVAFPMDTLGGVETQGLTTLRILPEPLSPADSDTIAWLENNYHADVHVGTYSSAIASFWDAPPHMPKIARGFFFAKNGTTGLHQAISRYQDEISNFLTEIVLGLIALIVIRITSHHAICKGFAANSA